VSGLKGRILVVGTGAVLVTAAGLAAFLSLTQVINPFAALTAAAVAVIGFVWFKKTSS
jgi:hypothetical protein